RKVKGVRVDRYERQVQPEMFGMPPWRPEWRGEAAYLHALNAVPSAQRTAATRAYMADPRDTATPIGAVRFLEALNQHELLSPASTDRLLSIMTLTATGRGRLYAALPDGASLAHKTGTARTDQGLNAAVNDIGIIRLKDGRKFAVAVFLSGTTLDDVGRDEVIAEVGRIVVKDTK
ncbi:MAG: serine hydrolase, partial [Caulobacter sp.]|nr:serine hydrolase [Caulobacter sp.]